ncbi:MAG: hypothetical protein GVY19_13415, partial [Bacteroidetes bacterium]|nr:hypothetical protein [Bacteroidota bacterium]
MKSKKLILSAMAIVLFAVFTSCEQDDIIGKNNIMPDKFKVDVPSSLSDNDSTKSAYLKSTASDDSLQGNDIYANLNLFIAVGESAAEVVEEIILSIA